MSVRQTIAQAQTLGEPLGEGEARVAQATVPRDGPRAWFGTDFNDRPVAYFEINLGELQSFAVSQVIDVAPVSTTIGDPAETVVTAKVTCREARLDDVFVAFMDDVTSQLGQQRSSVDVLVSSAGEWRNLLRIAKQGLSDSAAGGLYGELRFLEDLVGQLGPSGVDTWQRDGRNVHDFIGAGVRVEVKTSAFQNRHSVTIHGLKQLEPANTGKLILAVAEIEKHGGGEHLDTVVDRILDKGVPLDVLTDKLEEIGFVRGMGKVEGAPTFSLQSWRFWEISHDSPVLTTSAVGDHVATAVSDVQYSLQLSALGQASEEFEWQLFNNELHGEREG